MKKFMLFVFAGVMMISSMVCSVAAITSQEKEVKLMQIGEVYVPQDAVCVQEDNETVYYNFYDSVNDMHYAYYKPETGEHFAMSGPRYRDVSGVTTTGAMYSKSKIVAHDYSFNAMYTVNGKNNGITFTLPADTVYLSGDADLTRMADGKIMTNEYEDGYTYLIEVQQDKFWLPKSEKIYGIAGSGISGSFTAKEGTYYIIMTPVDRIHDGQRIEGYGSLYYYA